MVPRRLEQCRWIHEVHKIKFTAHLSEDIPTLFSEAANNLRAVLDQIAFAIAIKHTGNDNPSTPSFLWANWSEDAERPVRPR